MAWLLCLALGSLYGLALFGSVFLCFRFPLWLSYAIWLYVLGSLHGLALFDSASPCLSFLYGLASLSGSALDSLFGLAALPGSTSAPVSVAFSVFGSGSSSRPEVKLHRTSSFPACLCVHVGPALLLLLPSYLNSITLAPFPSIFVYM